MIADQPNGLAISGLIFAIVAILMCWLPLFGLPASVIAIGLCIGGLSKAKHLGSGKALSIAGLACSAVAIVLAIGVQLFINALGSGWNPNH